METVVCVKNLVFLRVDMMENHWFRNHVGVPEGGIDGTQLVL